MSGRDMWAVQFDRYGPPEVLALADVPRPQVRPGQTLVRVVATSINRLDLVYRCGKLRVVHGFGFPKGTGFDFVGVVESSPDPQAVPVGATVWGMLGIEPRSRRGAAAQYLALDRTQFGVLPGLDPDPELAALPLAAATALVCLRDTLALRGGQRVLVVGGSGGVGTAALQLAQVLGVTVDAVAGPGNLDLCEKLGADRTFSYRSTSPRDIDERYHGVLVAAGDPRAYRHLVLPGGRVACTAGDDWVKAVLRTPPGRAPRMRVVSVGPDTRDLEWLGEQVRRDLLRPVVDTVYPVADIVAAHRDAEAGHVRGKRVVVHPAD